MSEPEYTITIHVREPGRQYDPAFHLTLQCPHCCNAWFKRVEGSFNGTPVECVNCGTIINMENLFTVLAQRQTRLGE